MQKQILIGVITAAIIGIFAFSGNFFTSAVAERIDNPKEKFRQQIIDSLQSAQIIECKSELKEIKKGHYKFYNDQKEINQEVIFYLKLISKEVKGLAKYSDLITDRKLQRTIKDTIQ